MTEPGDPAPEERSAAPFLAALAIIVAVLIGVWLLNVLSSGEPTDDELIARAVAGQNDALQRADYADFRAHTCAPLLARPGGREAEVLDGQRDSAARRGERVIDRVGAATVDGDRAHAEVTYYFTKDSTAKATAPIDFAREDGAWKVCSTGPT